MAFPGVGGRRIGSYSVESRVSMLQAEKNPGDQLGSSVNALIATELYT